VSDPDRLYAALDDEDAHPDAGEMSASWRRCLVGHWVDPASRQAPQILTSRELRETRESVEDIVAAAREENDRLHAIVGKVGYVVLFTSPTGVVVDARGDPFRRDEFIHWGIWKGGNWAESVEGTNGIGTCIAEQRPVTVHRTQHFRTRHGSLSCCGAPVFGADGKLAAVLDVSSTDPEASDRSHALALAVTVSSARAIEEGLFRLTFRRAWTLAVAVPSTPGEVLMLAVDDDQRIVGADRNARSALHIDDSFSAAHPSLWAFFHRLPSIFRAGHVDMPVQLTRMESGELWRALITPPEKGVTSTHDAASHARPRIGREDHIVRAAVDPQFGELETGNALSPRERRILELIGQGQSNKEIARALQISPETVKTHIKNVFSKLGVERRAQAIYRATNLGLVSMP